MSTITSLGASDNGAVSRTTINTNFSNLNTDKIETSVLDTDTALTANSDAKIATQKAVKTFVENTITSNASEVLKGAVEEATDAEVVAGTATGGTGAKLFITPAKIVNREKYSVGSLVNTIAKTYFNYQFPFILWTGAVAGDTTTTFANWIRNSTDVTVLPGGAMVYFAGTGADSIYLNPPFFQTSPGTDLAWNLSGNIMVLDFFAKLPASSTGDINMGFDSSGDPTVAYTSSVANHVYFSQSSAGVLYANISKAGTGNSTTDISSGITTTDWNHYRIEITLSSEARFYVNGTLKATLSGTNFPTSASAVHLSFGRSNTASFAVTAPNFSFQMI